MRWFGLSFASFSKHICTSVSPRASTRVFADITPGCVQHLSSPGEGDKRRRERRREEKGEGKGEERKSLQKTHRSQNWYDVSHDRALFCETHFALSTCHASGVCRGICLRYITLVFCFNRPVAAGYATPAVRHHNETRNTFACQALQRDVWRAKKG